MTRIPKHQLDEVKRTVSLLALAQSQGHKFKKRGTDSYACLCPFHTEKTPSMVITPAKNLYHCFGCGAAGSVIDWQMNTNQQGLPAAMAFLRGQLTGEGAPSTSSLTVRPGVEASAPVRATLADLDDDGQALLNQVIDFYHRQLLDSSEAKAWLVQRGLTHPELITHFRLGYAGSHGVSGESGLLPSPDSKQGKLLRARLAGLGVLRATTKQDHFRGCVVVPVVGWEQSANVAQRGRVLQLYGRRTQADYKILKGSPKHLYLPSPLGGVWNEAALAASSEIILCEALIDAMTFWCAGYRQVIAAYGANGFTADHLAALRYHGVNRVLIAFDRDEAGDRGAASVAAQLLAAGIDAWRVRFLPGQDANAYALNSGNPENALGLALQQAQWMGDGAGPNVVFAHESATTPAATGGAPTTDRLAADPVKPVSAQPAPQASRPTSVSSLAVPAGAPASSASEVSAGELSANGELLMRCGPRVWRVRGWQKNSVAEVMKVNVQVRDDTTGAFHVDSLDMYHAKQRQGYINLAAVELGGETSVIKRECGRLLLMLEQKQDEIRLAAGQVASGAVTLSAEDERAALALLTSPDLASRITTDLAACGVVGEHTNLLTGYLAAVSRKLANPLAVLIQSSSAAGKSSLMDAVLSLMPPEERVQYSAMTGQSLYYLGENSLQHKILAIAEEEGVRQAAYALKLLQSDGELNIASTGKNEQSGELVTREYRVKGPVMLMLTTTAIDVDEELLNRCLVLTVNESREQTQAIQALQRHKQTLAGLLGESEKAYLTTQHQNAQRLLRPLKVVNPYADRLTFLSDKTRTRRDHMKYLTLIQAITLLHQYQREITRVNHRGQVIEYIEVTAADIALANRLAHEVLGRTLDEMPPQTRRLLVGLQGWVGEQAQRQALKAEELRFTRREVRAALGWGDTQLKIHLARLLEMEYLLLFRRGLTYEYSLLWDGDERDGPHLCGLLDVAGLPEMSASTAGNVNRSGSDAERSVAGRGAVGGRSAGKDKPSDHATPGLVTQPVGVAANTVIKEKNNDGMCSAAPKGEAAVTDNGEKYQNGQLKTAGNVNRSGSGGKRSASGRGVVGGRSAGKDKPSDHATPGLVIQPVGITPNTVIKEKTNAATAASLPTGAHREVTHG
ncbi:CHC2 zinc finger domain-containing protein [Acerihabitans sp. TG2]|uniref:CHC2 zinc finger domain-containing protein n=1 Tax=Acerihabitans sp. TG2 TaxID=3096008 RepID=UPI002B23947B|nr:CHC2 zinc finger domain-containing protein [Acerihabitans sp. TG2]MEA9393570.1 CHC2 zinc finger domain-containing protein [Acerihabitans sp. TG2]